MGTNITGGRLEWAEGRGDKIVNGEVIPFYESFKDNIKLESNTDFTLNDLDNMSISEQCIKIQENIGFDADIEFCITDDGLKWLQLRKVTRAIFNPSTLKSSVKSNLELIIKGEAASPYVSTGIAYRLDQHSGKNWSENKILVARATSPNDMMFIITSGGVVTKMGGMLSHAAVVCRELGKACVVGVDIEKIQHNNKITVNGKLGEIALKQNIY